MNCHGNNKENKGNKKHSHLKHMLHMIICCGLPILLIVALLPSITRYSPGAGRVFSIVIPFLCPIMMIFMMSKGDKEGGCCGNGHSHSNAPKLNEPTE
ncbi:hypothetical protein [Clostridium sp.]|uniref:hypothetical protein n=1 Tax=Clostridium sp. TaxID=1506 RepID=UPI00346455B8